MKVHRSDMPRCVGDRGSVVVETAIVLPLVFMFLMLLFDLSLVELKQSQLTSASRDGARAGIINWKGADTGSYAGGSCPATPSSFATICRSVLQRLSGSNADTINVICYVGTTATTEPCAAGGVTEGLDTMQVTVTYSYRPVTPPGQLVLGQTKSFTSSTRMVIQ